MSETRCEHTPPLEWRHISDRRPVPTNAAQEMVMAAFHAPYSLNGHEEPPLAQWNGFCPDCGSAVEWASDRPDHLKRWPSPRSSRTRRAGTP